MVMAGTLLFSFKHVAQAEDNTGYCRLCKPVLEVSAAYS